MKNRSRREFISSMALALPGVMWAAESGASPALWKPKQALSSVMFSELSLEEFCALAAKLGFTAIDLWGPFFGKCHHMAEAVKMGPDAFANLLKRHGLKVAAWTTYRVGEFKEGFPAFKDFIGACGGGIVVRESSYDGAEKNKLEESFRRFFGELGPEIEMARKHKVRLAIENHEDAILDTPESFEIFTRLNPSPDVVGVGIAPYHLQKRKADVASVIRGCGRQLLFFYAWQLARGKGQLPGHGPADFTPWLQALAEVGYTQWMVPFMHGELPVDEMTPAIAKAKSYLDNINILP